MTRTKIIATLGPASSNPDMTAMLVKAGVDIFRLNMSHGDRAAHAKLIRAIRRLPDIGHAGPVGIIGDLSGPKIRVGKLPGGAVELKHGAKVALVHGEAGDGAGVIPVDYHALGSGTRKGQKILLDDGMLELSVASAAPGRLDCRVVKGGLLKERKGVNFPGLPLELPSLTDKDIADLAMLIEQDVDYIALSFVRAPEDVTALRERIRAAGSDIPIIAKIERPEAVRRIREVVEVSDAVMVARGDLGVEMAPELVPPLQKKIIKLCHELKKPVITATQMLESMIKNPRPTRAEASDVAGAVFDGTDAVMLSGETAYGDYPVATVLMMDRIAAEAERHQGDGEYTAGEFADEVQAVAGSACLTAQKLGAKAIICFTRTGATALLVSKYRPTTTVIAATPDVRAFRRMRLYYGVKPVKVRLLSGTDRMLKEVQKAALARGLVREGDLAVLTLGVPAAMKSPTNLMKVHRVGEGFE